MIKAIIFDIDGVLINGNRFSEILESDHGITREKTSRFFTGVFQDCLLGKADLREEVQPFLEEWGWKESVDEFMWYWFTAEQNVDKDVFAFIELLKHQGIHVYVATNQEQYRTIHIWEKLGFSKIFAEIFSSAHIGHLKHQPIFFEKIIKKLPNGILKNEVLLWDDSPENIIAAKTFGIRAELYTSFDDFKKKMEILLRQGAQ